MNRFFSTLLLCVATALCVAGANPPAGGLPCLWHFDKARHAAHAATFVDEGYLTADGRPGATLRYLRADGNAPGGFVRTLGKSHNPAVRGGAAGCIPVGVAWSRVRSERPDIELYAADGSHPSYAGSYLAAAVICTTLTGAPFGAAPSDGLLDPDTAAYLRRVAEQTVLGRD